MMRFVILSSVVLMSSVWAGAPAAQTGFEDPSGRSSLVLNRGALAKFNVTDSRLSIAFVNDARSYTSGSKLLAGAEVSAKAADGIASVFTTEDGEGFAAETRGRLSVGVQHLLSPPRPPIGNAFVVDDWAGIEAGYERSEYTLIGDVTATSPTSEVEFDGGSVRGYYNALLSSNVWVGVSAGADRRNNYSQLSKASFVETVVARTNGDTTWTTTRTVSGRTGTYEAGWGAAAAADLVYFPRFLGGNIGFASYLRYADHDFVVDSFTQGIGLVVTQVGKPTQVVGSVTVEFVDGEVRAGLVAGFALGGGS